METFQMKVDHQMSIICTCSTALIPVQITAPVCTEEPPTNHRHCLSLTTALSAWQHRDPCAKGVKYRILSYYRRYWMNSKCGNTLVLRDFTFQIQHNINVLWISDCLLWRCPRFLGHADSHPVCLYIYPSAPQCLTVGQNWLATSPWHSISTGHVTRIQYRI